MHFYDSVIIEYRLEKIKTSRINWMASSIETILAILVDRPNKQLMSDIHTFFHLISAWIFHKVYILHIRKFHVLAWTINQALLDNAQVIVLFLVLDIFSRFKRLIATFLQHLHTAIVMF